jgi:hypothetical protein
MRLWNPVERASAHGRLASFFAAIDGSDAGRTETLGERNRRLLRLHNAFVGAPLEAHIKCANCGIDNEFSVPAASILGAPAAASESHVRIRSRGRSLTFRLPRMDDIEAAGRAATAREVRRVVLERCRMTGDLDALTDAAAERLGREFETRDPAANIVVSITCTGCRRALAASVDLAAFVAADLDRVVDSLYHDIDTIASAYGWDEPTIVSLPPYRRRRYIGIIAARAHARPKAQRAQ